MFFGIWIVAAVGLTKIVGLYQCDCRLQRRDRIGVGAFPFSRFGSLLLRRRAAPSEPRNDTYQKKGRTPKHEEDLHMDGTCGDTVLSSTPFGS